MSAKKLSNYYKYKAAIAIGAARVEHLPVEVSLEMANSCNFNCLFCAIRIKKPRPSGPSSLLASELVAKMAQAIPGALSVSLHGFGEPLLNSETVPMAKAIAEAGGLADFITNGSLLDAATAQALVDSGVWRVTVSISTSDPDDYARLYAGGRLEQLVANLEMLRDAKERAGANRPELTFNAIAMASTLPQLANLARLAARLKVSVLEVKPLITYQGPSPALSELICFNEAEHGQFITEAAAICASERIYFNADAFTSAPKAESKTDISSRRLIAPCALAFRGVSIRANGTVKPCCFADEAISLGDLNRQSLEEAWNSDEYIAFRRQHLACVVPKMCEHCVDWGLAPVNDAATDWLHIQGHAHFDPSEFFRLSAPVSVEIQADPATLAIGTLMRVKGALEELAAGATQLASLNSIASKLAVAASDFAHTAGKLIGMPDTNEQIQLKVGKLEAELALARSRVAETLWAGGC